MTTRPRHVQQVERTIDHLATPDDRDPVPERSTSVADQLERQRHEASHLGGHTKGGFAGALIGGAIGALLLWPFGFIGWGGAEVALGLRILTCAIIGALAGGTVGVVYWGGRLPELDGSTLSASGEPQSSTSPADPTTDERGRPT